jgi:hypothetical protein
MDVFLSLESGSHLFVSCAFFFSAGVQQTMDAGSQHPEKLVLAGMPQGRLRS